MEVLTGLAQQFRNRLAMARFATLLCFFVAGTAMQSPPQGEASVRESKVKAVFVYNFTQFVEWPAHAFENQSSPFVIGVLGSEEFSRYLRELVEGEKVAGRPVTLKLFSDITSDIAHCHILFVDASITSIENVLAITVDKPILTVGDNVDFTKQNGVLRFYIKDDKVRFEVNRAAAKQSELMLSPKLLKLATIYKN